MAVALLSVWIGKSIHKLKLRNHKEERDMSKIMMSLLAGSIALSSAGVASAAMSADEYKAAVKQAQATYKADRETCKSMKGNAQDVCVAEAKAKEKKAKAQAEADHKNDAKSRENAVVAAAEADYDVAKAKCDAHKGNQKDVCMKEAKAAETKAKANAKADRKATNAQGDAKEDKREADFNVAKEKCDAMSGDAKDRCIAQAKAKFGKS